MKIKRILSMVLALVLSIGAMSITALNPTQIPQPLSTPPAMTA